jgi:hypothetical protein
MKKYILTLLLIFSLFTAVNVNAEEYDSCYADYLVDNYSWLSSKVSHYVVESDSWKSSSMNSSLSLLYLFPVKSNTTYYLKFFVSDINSSLLDRVYLYDENKNYLTFSNAGDFDYSYDSDNYMLILNIPENANYSYLSLVFTYQYFNKSSFAFADVDLSECPSIKDETVTPSNPDNPSVVETEQSKIFANFYTLFLDKLKFISNYATNNYLFLAFLGVILSFIVLELFLNLYRGGGYRK